MPRLSSLFAILLAATAARAQGLQGLGGPGAILADPKTAAFEDALLAELNARRAKKNLPPFVADARLRGFMRKEAEMAARGDAAAGKIVERIKSQGMAPYGYYYSFGYGSQAQAVVAAMDKDKGFAAALYGELTRAGVGAFSIPGEAAPTFQVGVMLAGDADPMAGKPGLSRAETDAVMNAALPELKGCYDRLLESDPNLGGDILIKLVITGEGAVGEAAMLKSLGKVTFDQCALAVVGRLRFPKPYKGKPVTLNHPLRFTPPTGGRRVGKLTAAQIDIAFRQASYDFKACYDGRVAQKPALAGSMLLALTVQPDGAVRDVRMQEDDIGDAELTRCIIERARALRFPAPAHNGEVELTYPLRFESHKK